MTNDLKIASLYLRHQKNRSILKIYRMNMMLFKNQPDHKRLRMLVSKVFTPRIVEYNRPYIQETVNDLFNRVQNNKRMDNVSDIFYIISLVNIKFVKAYKKDLK